jgi:hypothetical protein
MGLYMAETKATAFTGLEAASCEIELTQRMKSEAEDSWGKRNGE